MKIVIIEDERLTADDLAESIVNILPDVQILAKLYSVKEAVTWFKKNDQPDLIFSDIQLGDGLSFEIFKQLSLTVPTVFCTAYDEYALIAFKANGIDYILKPFDEQNITDALEKYKALEKKFSVNAVSFENILQFFDSRKMQKKSSVLVYQGDKILPVRMEDITLFYIKNGVTQLITFNQKTYSINKSLEELEKITGSDFYRANRQYLINRKAIKEASQHFARKLSVTLTIPVQEKILVNKVKVTEFLNWLSEN
ncbi:Sensory transduction protein LytR [termite gut metagenome]|uniref:Sensory transduction protein LytR n=1 Tax=termite gut metagenome TaxID=433724 RepID=A0A5J4RJJ1_9ZZZZ